MKYRLLGLGVGVLSLCLASACGGSSTTDEAASPTAAASESPAASPTTGGETANTNDPDDQGPVAVVNDEEISREDFEMQFDLLEQSYAQQGVALPEGDEAAQLRQDVVRQLVQQTLVLQEAKERNIEATDEEISTQYDTVLASFPDEATFNETLEAEGLTQESLEALIAEDIRIQKLLDGVIAEAALAPPTDEELQELYDQVAQVQELPPFEEIRADLEAELQDQRETAVIQDFVAGLEAESSIEILLDS